MLYFLFSTVCVLLLQTAVQLLCFKQKWLQVINIIKASNFSSMSWWLRNTNSCLSWEILLKTVFFFPETDETLTGYHKKKSVTEKLFFSPQHSNFADTFSTSAALLYM